GNVRELENAIHQAVIMCSSDQVSVSDLGPAATLASSVALMGTTSAVRVLQADEETSAWAALDRALSDLLPHAPPELHARVEAFLMAAAFRHSGNNQLETARLLGL